MSSRRGCILSKFHAHRTIAAAAGEPPGALRRRIMLERAACRLLSTGDEVLEVALDAGYSSHEAFTRAGAGITGLGDGDPMRYVAEAV